MFDRLFEAYLELKGEDGWAPLASLVERLKEMGVENPRGVLQGLVGEGQAELHPQRLNLIRLKKADPQLEDGEVKAVLALLEAGEADLSKLAELASLHLKIDRQRLAAAVNRLVQLSYAEWKPGNILAITGKGLARLSKPAEPVEPRTCGQCLQLPRKMQGSRMRQL